MTTTAADFDGLLDVYADASAAVIDAELAYAERKHVVTTELCRLDRKLNPARAEERARLAAADQRRALAAAQATQRIAAWAIERELSDAAKAER